MTSSPPKMWICQGHSGCPHSHQTGLILLTRMQAPALHSHLLGGSRQQTEECASKLRLQEPTRPRQTGYRVCSPSGGSLLEKTRGGGV